MNPYCDIDEIIFQRVKEKHRYFTMSVTSDDPVGIVNMARFKTK